MFPSVYTTLALCLFFLLSSSALGNIDQGIERSSGCLPHFRSEPAHFEPCKSKICFLFRSEIPYVILDSRMMAENNQTLFKCKDRARLFPDLSGITFVDMDGAALLDDALCVYGGNQCSYSGLMDFLGEHSSPAEGYRFAVVGFGDARGDPFPQVRHTSSAVHFTEHKIVALEPQTGLLCTSAVSNIMDAAFNWSCVALFAAVISILWQTRNAIMGGHLSSSARFTPVQLSRDFGKNLSHFFVAVMVMSVLMVSKLMVSKWMAQLLHSWSQCGFSERQLSTCAVCLDGAQEFFFRQIVDRHGRYRDSSVPWHTCVDFNDCYEKIMNKSHPAKRMVMHDFLVTDMLHDTTFLHKTTLTSVFEMWYFSFNIPGDVISNVPRNLSDWMMTDERLAIFSRMAPAWHPENQIQTISMYHISVLVIAHVLVIVPLIALLVLCSWIRFYMQKMMRFLIIEDDVSPILRIGKPGTVSTVSKLELQSGRSTGSTVSKLGLQSGLRTASRDRDYDESISNGTKLSPAVLMELLKLTNAQRSKRIASILRAATVAGANWGNAAQFSSRFSAVWAEIEGRDGMVWFCIMDGEHSVFVLESLSSVPVGKIEGHVIRFQGKRVPVNCLNIPTERVSWSTLLQSAVDFTKSDNTVRAILVACLVSANDAYGNSCVYDALVPKSLPSLSTRIEFDIPVDVDMMTTLADPLSIEGQLYFKCGIGTMARAVGQENGVCHLEGMTVEDLVPQSEPEQMETRLPILYGYGNLLRVESDVPCTTSQIGDILDKLPSQGSVSKLLWAIINVAGNLYSAGNLDLSAAAGVIFDTHGAFLGAGKRRRVKGDILIVGKDGIYKSSRFRNVALEGSCEVNLAVLKLGLKVGPQVDTMKDKRIDNLSVIAEHILGREYKLQYFDNRNENVVRGPSDLWSNETAVCNTLVALLCRKYGRFTGFSAVVSTPTSIRTPQSATMEANIFLPALNVWEHPHSYMLRQMSRRLKIFLGRVLTFTYSENVSGLQLIPTMIWNVIVACVASRNQWPEGLVRSLIMEYWNPSISRVHKFCFQDYKVAAYPGPMLLCDKFPTDGVIEIAADVLNDM